MIVLAFSIGLMEWIHIRISILHIQCRGGKAAVGKISAVFSPLQRAYYLMNPLAFLHLNTVE